MHLDESGNHGKIQTDATSQPEATHVNIIIEDHGPTGNDILEYLDLPLSWVHDLCPLPSKTASVHMH